MSCGASGKIGSRTLPDMLLKIKEEIGVDTARGPTLWVWQSRIRFGIQQDHAGKRRPLTDSRAVSGRLHLKPSRGAAGGRLGTGRGRNKAGMFHEFNDLVYPRTDQGFGPERARLQPLPYRRPSTLGG
jgi:hypothetical protein